MHNQTYYTHAALSNGSQTKMMAMHDAIEKISIFAAATNVGQTSDIVSAKYSEYASLLANEGDLSAAINYLRVASAQPSSGEQHCATLMDRIYRAQTTESQMLQTQNHQPPPFPFQRVNVEVDPNMIQRLQQEAQEAARKQAEEQARKRQEEMQRQQQEAQARAAREAAQRNQFSAQRAPATQWGQPQGMQQRQPQYGQPARPVQPQANAYHQPQQFHAQQPAANTFNNQQRAPGMQQQRPPQQQAPQQWNRQQPQPTPVQRPAPVPVQAHRTNAYKPPMQQTPYGQQPQARAPVPAAAPAFQQQNKYTPQTNQFQPQQQQQPQRQPMQQQQQQPQQPARQFTPVQAQAPAPVPVPAKQPTVFTPGASGAPSVNGSGMNGAAASAPAPATVAPELGPQHKQMQGTLSNCFTNLMSQQLKSLDRKKLSNAQPKLEHLYTILPTISPPAQAVLQELCGAIANNDFATAQKHHTTLVTKYWNGNDHWLPSLRTLVLIGKKLLK